MRFTQTISSLDLIIVSHSGDVASSPRIIWLAAVASITRCHYCPLDLIKSVDVLCQVYRSSQSSLCHTTVGLSGFFREFRSLIIYIYCN